MKWIDTSRHLLKTGLLALLITMPIGWCEVVWGQNEVWTYDFGTGIGTHTTDESINFLNTPQANGGTARVRVGSSDGAISLESSTISTFSQAKLQAAETTSDVLLQISGFSSSTTFYIKFSIKFTGGNSGTIGFLFGNGTNFLGNSGYVGSSFAGFRSSFELDGTLLTERRTGTGWSDAFSIGNIFSKDQKYDVEIYANNSGSTATYFRNGSENSLASEEWALWVNGVKFDDFGSVGLTVNDVIDGFLFYGQNSTGNVAEIEIDDIVYSNSLPDIRRIDNFTNYSTDGEWRMLSLPYDATVEQLARQNLVQGIPGSFPGAGANIFTSQNGTGEAGAQDSDWTAPAGLSETIERGQGFIWLLFDNAMITESKPLPMGLTIASGTNNSADLDVALSSGNDGWNLLGNPFSEDLEVGDIANWTLATGSLTSSVAQVYNPETDSYEVLNGATDKVASFQGFFLQNDDATKITIPATAQSSGATFYKQRDRQMVISIKVHSTENNAGKEFTDSALELFFSESADHGWDLWDASKLTPLSNQYIGMAFTGDQNGKRVLKAQDSRPYNVEEPFTIPAEFFSAGLDGSAEISIAEVSNIPEGWSVEIEDTFSGKRQLIDERTPFRFDFKSTMVAKEVVHGMKSTPVIQSAEISAESPRFLIHISPDQNASSTLPSDFTLNQNYPNPFNPTTVISYDLPENSQVNLAVYDMMGRRVVTLVNENVTAGTHQVQFDASSLSSGTYMYRLQAGGSIQTKKLTLIK